MDDRLMEALIDARDMAGCEAVDGCWVEPDGYCQHGSPSLILQAGMI